MWIFTNFGAFSVVQDDKNPHEVMVRSRRRVDLVELRKRYVPDLVIINTPDNDYHWRAFTTRIAVAEALKQIAYDIDYGNFKDSVRDARLHDAYVDVWSAMYRAFGGYGRKIKSAARAATSGAWKSWDDWEADQRAKELEPRRPAGRKRRNRRGKGKSRERDVA